MSKYELYDKTCRNYDNGRCAAGVDIFAGLLQVHLKKKLKDIHILDAGCGTGNYTIAMLRHGVGKVSMMDASTGMLKKAKEKLVENCMEANVDVKQAFLPSMPYADESFDAVMINQVLHHLQKTPNGETFKEWQDTILEAKRILKPSGILLINESTQEQMSNAVWYMCLHKNVMLKHRLRFPPAKKMRMILEESNFNVINFVSVLGNDMFPHYKNLEGPLDKTYRDSDSFWAHATEKEVEEIMTRVLKMKEAGTLTRFFEENDKTDEIGYFCIIAAVKNISSIASV